MDASALPRLYQVASSSLLSSFFEVVQLLSHQHQLRFDVLELVSVRGALVGFRRLLLFVFGLLGVLRGCHDSVSLVQSSLAFYPLFTKVLDLIGEFCEFFVQFLLVGCKLSNFFHGGLVDMVQIFPQVVFVPILLFLKFGIFVFDPIQLGVDIRQLSFLNYQLSF